MDYVIIDLAKFREILYCWSNALTSAPLLNRNTTKGENTIYVIWATTRQNVSSGVSNQARHKPACAATEAS